MINSFHIRLAVRVLRRGGIIAYPTEGVWGLGCDPFNPNAVARLLELKRRDVTKGLILVAADIVQFAPFLHSITNAQCAQLAASWPGPHTWVVAHGGALPDWVTGYKPTVALRVSAHPIVSALCKAYRGPIVSTSANSSGRQPALSALGVRRYFNAEVDYVLQGNLGGQAGPTPIRDLTSGRLLREG